MTKRRKKSRTRIAAIFRALSDDKSLELFKLIARSGDAAANHDGDDDGMTGAGLKADSKSLSRKQFYSRLSALLKAGLVRRTKGRYMLTSAW